ncbi:hypothetical protein BRD01_09475 [Halobacteriales archaeon QS_8_65_32]|nr:MAG: hypothetical protein BRD01_09475 [Halobacteriales archaeon QS_8_65_32]
MILALTYRLQPVEKFARVFECVKLIQNYDYIVVFEELADSIQVFVRAAPAAGSVEIEEL